MARICAVTLTLCLCTQIANAESLDHMIKGVGGNSCWQRVYSQADLGAHPKQKIASVRLSSEVQDDGNVAVSLHMNLRKRVRAGAYDYSIFGYCKASAKSVTCTPEWDAGSFVIEKGARNGLRVRNRNLIVNPSNYDSEDVSDDAVNLSKSDDAIWLLFPAEAEVCDAK
jgi:hypothetical protein